MSNRHDFGKEESGSGMSEKWKAVELKRKEKKKKRKKRGEKHSKIRV